MYEFSVFHLLTSFFFHQWIKSVAETEEDEDTSCQGAVMCVILNVQETSPEREGDVKPASGNEMSTVISLDGQKSFSHPFASTKSFE